MANSVWHAHLKSSDGALMSYLEYLESLREVLNTQRSKTWEDELRRQGELDCIAKLANFITADEREDRAYQDYQYRAKGES